ncbi:MAG: rhodanese-like domain-containing protein [Acidimicrobiales bacterium]
MPASRSFAPSKLLLVPALAAVLGLVAACGGGTTTDADEGVAPVQAADPGNGSEADAGRQSRAGVRLVSPSEGAAIQAESPQDLVILDVRTPEEFGQGHLQGAVVLDFYEPDFEDLLGQLDPDVPYLLYCQSGNRSGQTAAIMDRLGFSDVAAVDGGIVAWEADGLPVVDR